MKKLLVIEDTLEVRENLCEILELSNYEVHSAKNGKEGLIKAKDVIPDLILCDVMMPELDGFGVLKILNKTPSINHIPFIFLTAKAEKSDIRTGMGLGAEDYITKPFNDVELLEAIEIRLKKAERIEKASQDNEEGYRTFFSEAKANKELEALSANRELREYDKKVTIFEEGKTARWLYCIESGEVKTIQTNEYGKELTTKIYSKGDFFGYFALINDSPYNQSAITLSDVSLRLIPKDDFMLLLYNSRDFSSHFIKMIANRTESVEQKLIDLAYSSVRIKVANALLSLVKDKKAEVNSIDISRDDLASVAGIAKETLIRTLSDFKGEGLIQVSKNSITLNNILDLENLIG